MQDRESILPTDQFSIERRKMNDNEGAIGAGSTVHIRDFYGNLESWIVETFRVDGQEVAFIQRNKADGGDRFVLPVEIMAVISRQRDQVIARARRRAARTGAATRKAQGFKPTPPKRKAVK